MNRYIIYRIQYASYKIICLIDIFQTKQNLLLLFYEQQQQSLERLDDASTELMMGSDGDNVMLLIGESFFDTSEEDATEYCEAEVERMSGELEILDGEESTILERQAELKKLLYGRFGKSIQLEA